MLYLPLFLAATFGSGSSSTQQTPPLPGPPSPTQSVIPTSPSTQHPGQKPQQPIDTRGILQQKIQEKEAESFAQGPLYVFPGVVRSRDGQWVGYDYLYNVGNNIPVEVNIVKPSDASVPMSEEGIRQKILEEFQKAGIDTTINTVGGRPPHAIFNMMVLIYPVNDGFIALCDGRLLETVDVKRVTPSPSEGVFQAITWEHKNLIVGPTDTFSSLLNQTIENITRTFIERYKFFESFRKRQEGGVMQ